MSFKIRKDGTVQVWNDANEPVLGGEADDAATYRFLTECPMLDQADDATREKVNAFGLEVRDALVIYRMLPVGMGRATAAMLEE